MSKEKRTVLALYPNRYGISYAVFDSPEDLVDCGVGYIQPVSNKKTIDRVKNYLNYFKPEIVITRDLNDIGPRKSKRINKLLDQITKEARSRKLEVHQFTRSQIKNVFEQFGAKSKYQIGKKIVSWYKPLKKYQTPKRKKWMAENYNVGIFDAVSLAMVFYFLRE